MIALRILRDLLILLIPFTYEELVSLFSPKTLVEFNYVKRIEAGLKKKVKLLESLIEKLI